MPPSSAQVLQERGLRCVWREAARVSRCSTPLTHEKSRAVEASQGAR